MSGRQANIFERDLERNPANYQPLTPLTFLDRSASVYPSKTAVIHGETKFSYREFYDRCRRLASALARRGIGEGDTVAVMAPNVPALLEAHYGVPMEVLYRYPEVMEAAVVAMPDARWSETPCAFVTWKPDAGETTADELIRWCREHMAHFKAPKTVVFGPLPKTSTGKIQKFELRERARHL
jgi:acyl-CoA synthetase (AMP-forming)/AMP-acid ligase II